MKISLVTPAPPNSRAGNRATALRWAGLLEDLGHDVSIATAYDREQADALLAIHAWRSAASIERFARLHPHRPLVVGLAGTDVYDFLKSHRETVLRSLDLASALIGLHDLVGEALPVRFGDKVTVVYQSALPPPGGLAKAPLAGHFDVLVVGHLRDEKDPLRAAEAARRLPPESRIVVEHLGRAHNSAWAERARIETAANPRYVWRGEVGGAEVRAKLSASRVMVISSIMEGGANVVSEGDRRRHAGARLGHPRLDRASRARLRRLFSDRRHAGAGRAVATDGGGARLPRPPRGAVRGTRGAVHARTRTRRIAARVGTRHGGEQCASVT